MRAGDTIFALSSGRPPAAVAIIRISGPSAHEALRVVAGCDCEERHATLVTLRDPESDEVIDRALALKFTAPGSATGENIAEFQCHGGKAVVDRILAVLAGIAGYRLAEPGEFTRRAFANGRIDLTEAEGLADLLEAETEAQRKVALFAAEGGIRRQVALWAERVTILSAQAEASIDYVGDDDETALDSDRLAADAALVATEIADWLARPRLERLKEGVRVVAAGPPNAGKSSLINALSESDRAIVTEIEGTTRDVIEIPVSHRGIPFLLIDTAGLRETADPVERIGVDRAGTEVGRADILLWLGNPSSPPPHSSLVLLHPRSDETGRENVPPDTTPVSAMTGEGLKELWAEIHEKAIALLPGEDRIALNRRQVSCLEDCLAELNAVTETGEIVLKAHHLGLARNALDRLTGRAGVEDMLDALFGRFCLGK